MRKINWEVKVAVILIAMSICIYACKLIFLKNPSDTANYIFNALGFLPINVLLVTIVLNKLLAVRAKRERMEKMNMVIGTFFSEVGNGLLSRLVSGDAAIDRLKGSLMPGSSWGEKEFAGVRKTVAGYDFQVDTAAMDMQKLGEFLISRRDFMLRLLENPVLLEHESFTNLLRAVFHLAEELRYREDFSSLPNTDHLHLAGDIRRVYEILIIHWLDYMEYLKNNYPYLYSLEMRKNPFDINASPVVR